MIACILTSALYSFRYVHFYLCSTVCNLSFSSTALEIFLCCHWFPAVSLWCGWHIPTCIRLSDIAPKVTEALCISAPPPLVLAFRLRFVELIFPLLHTYWSFLPQTIIFSWWQPLNVFFRYCLFYLCSIWVFFFFLYLSFSPHRKEAHYRLRLQDFYWGCWHGTYPILDLLKESSCSA